jgi:hypothetical protein
MRRLMRKSLTISVTPEDIDNGVTSCDRCPVALAVRRQFPKARVAVGITCFEVMTRFRTRWYDLPPEARQFIHDFDCRGGTKPLTFTAARE